MKKRICVVGGGRWGENHIRTLYRMGNLAGLVEADRRRLEELLKEYPVAGFAEIEGALEQGFDGYVLATPAESHYPLGKMLLERGLNTLIEKPMALSSRHSAELLAVAAKTGARLMVGHLLLFHPAIRKIKEIIESGKIGVLRYLYSTRLQLGTVRTTESVFWSFAPHDISILDYLVGEPAVKIEAKGAGFLQEGIPDVTLAQFEYPGNIHAHIFVSWLHPFKEQRLVVVGSRGMLSYDDSSGERSIRYHRKRIAWEGGRPIPVEEPDEIIAYQKGQPLAGELAYFVENLDGEIAISGGETGHQVVRVLEKVHRQIMEKK